MKYCEFCEAVYLDYIKKCEICERKLESLDKKYWVIENGNTLL